jgi:hypothetical protein
MQIMLVGLMKKVTITIGSSLALGMALILGFLLGNQRAEMGKREIRALTKAQCLGLTWSFLQTIETQGPKQCKVKMQGLLDALIPQVEQSLEILDEQNRSAMMRNFTYISIYNRNFRKNYTSNDLIEWSESTAKILSNYYENAPEEKFEKAKQRWGRPEVPVDS